MEEVIILVLGQALGVEDREPNLLLLNQLQENGIVVNNVPSRLPGGDVKNPYSIYFLEEDITIQLKVKEVVWRFDTRIPTQSNLDTCKHIFLTNNSKWGHIGSGLDQ